MAASNGEIGIVEVGVGDDGVEGWRVIGAAMDGVVLGVATVFKYLGSSPCRPLMSDGHATG